MRNLICIVRLHRKSAARGGYSHDFTSVKQAVVVCEQNLLALASRPNHGWPMRESPADLRSHKWRQLSRAYAVGQLFPSS